jgi:two-component system response regulator MprA
MTAMSINDLPHIAPLSQGRVLLVESDTRMATFLDRALAAAGYRVEHKADDAGALARCAALAPDIVLLDPVLPGPDGLNLLRRLRATGGVPILVLGYGNTVEDRVAALDAGADDYLARPFALEELLARLRALLRGRAMASTFALATVLRGSLTYADVRLDHDTRQAWRGERKLELRNKGFELLAFFLRHPQRVLSRRELLEAVWRYDFLGDSNVIDVTISHLRQALEAAGEPRLIHTVRPVGYILNART